MMNRQRVMRVAKKNDLNLTAQTVKLLEDTTDLVDFTLYGPYNLLGFRTKGLPRELINLNHRSWGVLDDRLVILPVEDNKFRKTI